MTWEEMQRRKDRILDEIAEIDDEIHELQTKHNELMDEYNEYPSDRTMDDEYERSV